MTKKEFELYLGGLNDEINEKDIIDHFKKYRYEITRFCRKTKDYGFIFFEGGKYNFDELIETMNSTIIIKKDKNQEIKRTIKIRKLVYCFNCGQVGHTLEMCWYKDNSESCRRISIDRSRSPKRRSRSPKRRSRSPKRRSNSPKRRSSSPKRRSRSPRRRSRERTRSPRRRSKSPKLIKKEEEEYPRFENRGQIPIQDLERFQSNFLYFFKKRTDLDQHIRCFGNFINLRVEPDLVKLSHWYNENRYIMERLLFINIPPMIIEFNSPYYILYNKSLFMFGPAYTTYLKINEIFKNVY